MSGKIKGLTVVFEEDVDDDHAQNIIDALLMIKGVANVSASVCDVDDYINRQKVSNEISRKIYDLYREIINIS